MSQFRIPSYNLLRYDIDNLPKEETYAALKYFIILANRYPSNQIQELHNWFLSLSFSKLTELQLYFSRNELVSKSYIIIAYDSYNTQQPFNTFPLHKYSSSLFGRCRQT